jgi:hypothetical protein
VREKEGTSVPLHYVCTLARDSGSIFAYYVVPGGIPFEAFVAS